MDVCNYFKTLKIQDTGLGILLLREGDDLRKKVVHIINIELHLQVSSFDMLIIFPPFSSDHTNVVVQRSVIVAGIHQAGVLKFYK